jgi:hypothetical protein
MPFGLAVPRHRPTEGSSNRTSVGKRRAGARLLSRPDHIVDITPERQKAVFAPLDHYFRPEVTDL